MFGGVTEPQKCLGGVLYTNQDPTLRMNAILLLKNMKNTVNYPIPSANWLHQNVSKNSISIPNLHPSMPFTVGIKWRCTVSKFGLSMNWPRLVIPWLPNNDFMISSSGAPGKRSHRSTRCFGASVWIWNRHDKQQTSWRWSRKRDERSVFFFFVLDWGRTICPCDMWGVTGASESTRKQASN